MQEYERAVIFRLGLLLSDGARGPGVFFIIPCVDVFEIIDMRVQTFNVPPQEVSCSFTFSYTKDNALDPDEGQRDGVCERHHVVQGGGCYQCSGQCG